MAIPRCHLSIACSSFNERSILNLEPLFFSFFLLCSYTGGVQPWLLSVTHFWSLPSKSVHAPPCHHLTWWIPHHLVSVMCYLSVLLLSIHCYLAVIRARISRIHRLAVRPSNRENQEGPMVFCSSLLRKKFSLASLGSFRDHR